MSQKKKKTKCGNENIRTKLGYLFAVAEYPLRGIQKLNKKIHILFFKTHFSKYSVYLNAFFAFLVSFCSQITFSLVGKIILWHTKRNFLIILYRRGKNDKQQLKTINQ